MLALEEVVWEDTNEHGLPPGFRFHPTDEELITFYLASKVFNRSFSSVEIAEVDLRRWEPWELPDVAKMGAREWYFFSLRDRKYPSGTRTNRATVAGYWKGTGKDRKVYNASNGELLGMKKALVFYRGRAPRGEKTKWVMHEYRLDGHLSYLHASKDEWVICRIFYKTGGEKKNPCIKSSSSYFLEASPPPTIYLPPLLDPSTLHSPRQTLSNPHMVLQEYNPSSQNSLHYPATLQPLPSPTNPSILKSLSHQFLLKEPLIPKECKMGNSMFSITNWVDIDHQLLQSHCTHDKCLGAFGLSAAGVAHDMSPSISFDRTGFQMVDAEPW
ncbi:hypothetical protein MRB53_017536 [Persea americana]|uniref:Uncharacterized protein n=1 Tax=Persea americana TaxID=3435 RepID=A0ACC2M4X9_PERAE|nr:hypothetical protein MRB53_017536 [Persea americana]